MDKVKICEAATLCSDSYSSENQFNLLTEIRTNGDDFEVIYISVDEADVFVINNHTKLKSYVVVRGTENKGYGLVRDWIRNICSLIPYPTKTGLYPLGFYFGFKKVQKKVEDAILYPYDSTITGHSQGAAIAGIALSEWLNTSHTPARGVLVAPPLMLGLFNSAKVSGHYGDNLVRVENNTDIVTYLGIPGIFFKPGHLVYIDSQNKAHYTVRNRSWMIVDKLKGLVAALTPNGFLKYLKLDEVVLDHDINDYVEALCKE